MRHSLRAVASLVIASGFAAWAFASAAAAAPAQASFALKPVTYDPALPQTKSYYIFAAHRGDTLYGRVRVTNVGGATGTVYLYTVDATTGQTGGAVYLARGNRRLDAGGWVRLEVQKAVLRPGQSVIVPFVVRVPVRVRAGDHLGGIVAENAQVTGSTGHGKGAALQIRIRHLTIAAVQVTLPGRQIKHVTATGVNAGGQNNYQQLFLHLRNEGTVMVKPHALLAVHNSAGRLILNRSIQFDTFLPQTQIAYPVFLRRALTPGTYRATVTLTNGSGVPGYRLGLSSSSSPRTTRSFTFIVSGRSYTQVFGDPNGTTQTQAPKARVQKPSSRAAVNVTMLTLVLVAALSALAALAVVIVHRRPLTRP
jgi:hypothetical protein